MRSPLDIGRAARFLMQRYGDDSAIVALHRAQHSAGLDDAVAASEWHSVGAALKAYIFAEPSGPLH